MAEIESFADEEFIRVSSELNKLLRDLAEIAGHPVPEDADENELNEIIECVLAEFDENTRFIRERECSQGGILAGGDCRKAIQPEPLDAMTRTTLLCRGKRDFFPLPNGE